MGLSQLARTMFTMSTERLHKSAWWYIGWSKITYRLV